MSQRIDQHAGARPTSRAWRRVMLSLLCVSMAAGAGCCINVRRTIDNSLKRLEARAAYANCPAPGLPLAYERHYQRGFTRGYVAVAKGKRACPPATPPSQYWTHKYESPQGKQFVTTWYDGWRAGAATAKAHGVDACHRVPAICSDCDCRSTCTAPVAGVLPRPEVVRAAALTAPPRHPAPVRLPPATEPATIDSGSATRPAGAPSAETIAPPPPQTE